VFKRLEAFRKASEVIVKNILSILFLCLFVACLPQEYNNCQDQFKDNSKELESCFTGVNYAYNLGIETNKLTISEAQLIGQYEAILQDCTSQTISLACEYGVNCVFQKYICTFMPRIIVTGGSRDRFCEELDAKIISKSYF